MQTSFNYDCTPRHVHLCAFNASRFTGKERDTESILDYFGARHYASSMGRWMVPDRGLAHL
jgi:RHS repeat-associated protein